MQSTRTPVKITIENGLVSFACPWCGILEHHPTREGETEWTVTAPCCVTTEAESNDPQAETSILKTRIVIS